MPSDFPALSELTRYVPATGDAIALHLTDGTAERVIVKSAAGSHIVVRTVLHAEPGDAVSLVWRMDDGRARCVARVAGGSGDELELALGTVTVREMRRARRLAPTRRVTAAIHLADGTVVDGRLLDVSDGGGAVIVPAGSVHPGLVAHVAFASAGEHDVEADCVVMHASPRDGETVVGLAFETGSTGLLRLAGLAD
jgi:PilZ domain-containing protein